MTDHRPPSIMARLGRRALALLGLAGALEERKAPTIRVRHAAREWSPRPARRHRFSARYRATKPRRPSRAERKRRRLAVKAARRANRGAPRR